MAAQLVPYIFFYGRCEEALEFYKTVFDGSYEVTRVADTPFASEQPSDAANRIMHASFTADEIVFMAADGRDIKPVDIEAGNISLSLSLDDAARGEHLFNALAVGGTIGMPIGKAFWGGRFGILTDRFGTEWMMVLP